MTILSLLICLPLLSQTEMGESQFHIQMGYSSCILPVDCNPFLHEKSRWNGIDIRNIRYRHNDQLVDVLLLLEDVPSNARLPMHQVLIEVVSKCMINLQSDYCFISSDRNYEYQSGYMLQSLLYPS